MRVLGAMYHRPWIKTKFLTINQNITGTESTDKIFDYLLKFNMQAILGS